MSQRRTASLSLLLLVAIGVCRSVQAAPPAPQGEALYWDSYWQGLMQMRAGEWARAAASLSDAAQRAGGDARPFLARGAVLAIAGNFENARSDLARAKFLKSREPLLWNYAIDAMTNTSSDGRGIPIPRSLQKPGQANATFSGVPGHMIQGGDDYPTSYASALIYQLAMPYSDAREAKRATDSPQLEAARRLIGRWFANRMLATPEMASRGFAEAQRLMAADKLREARDLLDLARAVYPFDADMATTSGDIWLRAGRPETARHDYTIAATMRTDLAGAYAGRAEAAAMLGDGARANADFALVERYGKAPADLRQRIDALLKQSRADDDPASLLAAMDKAAAGGADVSELTGDAERLHRALAEKRVRYDEIYQETIRRYEDAIRADRSDVKSRVDLAQYLHDESELRGEKVEPRRGLVAYRYQHTKEMELGRALHYVNQALDIKKDHVPALVTKAYVLSALGRNAEAERLIDVAMKQVGAANADAVRLLAKFRKWQIGNMLMQAIGLRTPTYSESVSYETRSDGVWKVTTTTRHDPSDADLATADALQRQAQALMAQTKQLMESAVAATRGTLDGMLLESSYEDWFGSRNKALVLLDKCVKTYPKSLEAHDALITYLRFLGQYDTALRQEAASWQLFQTTCGPLLTLVWRNIAQQGWAAMVNDLEHARRLDPLDARATAYLAIARREARDIPVAIGLLKVAAALDQARLNLDDRGVARDWPRPAGDLANAMQIHQDLALALKSTGHADKALLHYVAAGDYALRFSPDGVATPMHGAMRPDPNAPQLPVPAPVNGATLASRAHLGAAEALKAAGRNDEAQRYYQAAAKNVRPHDSMTPNVGNGRGDNNFSGFAEGASATALIELAKNDIANKRYQDAFRKLQDATQASPTRDERRLINELTLQILPHINDVTRRPQDEARANGAAELIAQAKQAMTRRDFRNANLLLNRAAQSGATNEQRQEIQQLLLRIARER